MTVAGEKLAGYRALACAEDAAPCRPPSMAKKRVISVSMRVRVMPSLSLLNCSISPSEISLEWYIMTILASPAVGLSCASAGKPVAASSVPLAPTPARRRKSRRPKCLLGCVLFHCTLSLNSIEPLSISCDVSFPSMANPSFTMRHIPAIKLRPAAPWAQRRIAVRSAEC